jgi:putative DNA primase/helicase
MALDDAFEAWRRRALDSKILEVATGGIVNAKLRKKSREHVGPCPLCGGGSQVKGKHRPADGFSVNPAKNVFNCRRGGVGGDVIAMVMHTCGVSFLAACELITGEPPPARGSVITEETRKKSEQLQAEAAERERRRIEDDNIYRQREIRTVRDIYDRAHPFAGSSAEIYAGIRGLTFPPVPADRAAPIKCVEAMPYHVDKDTIVHRGPAMVAPIINSSREFQGLHFTYLDLALPKGKLQLEHEGEPLDAKKSRGSKQGNFIALFGPPAPAFLVIGEAIEKTVAVYMALAATGRDLSDASFWSACDLGNLAGKSTATVVHPTLKNEKTGRSIKVAGGTPDLTTPAIDIPDSVTDLVLLGDSTSDPFTTKHAMARAAARYSRPGRTVRVAWAPGGMDFDDLLREARGDELATATALKTVADIVDSAPIALDQATTSPPADEVDPSILTQAIRKFGLEQLNAGLAQIRASTSDDRAAVLSAIAELLGQLVGAGAIEEPFAKATLEDAALSCGLIGEIGIKAVRSAIAAGLKLGKKHPRDLDHVRREATALSRPRLAAVIEPSPSTESEPFPPPDASASSSSSAAPSPPADGGEFASSQMGDWPEAAASTGHGGTPREPEEDSHARNMRLAFFPLTDLGNAERFRERYRNRLLWNVALGWLVWDGRRWSREGADDLVKIAEHETVRAIQHEAEAVASSGDRDGDDAEDGARDFVFEEKRDGEKVMYSDKIARWGRSSEAANKLGALSKRGAPYFAISIDKLDSDKMKINVGNGTLVVRPRSDGDYVHFKPHDPADLITKLAPVDYDPAAVCPDYDKFLARVQPIKEMRLFLHQWLGLSLTGDVSEQKLAFLYGKGSNGKSVLIDAVSYVAGDYGETVPIETFLDQGKSRSAGQATPDLAILPGVRMLRTSEPEKNSRLAEAMVKLVTGGEPIQARHLNRDFFKFYPQFKLTISGNYRPAISGSDEGIWRRLRLVPFNVFIPKEERDIHLADKLRAEASGILNRLLDGLRDWCDKGLSEPEAVASATAEYRSASDPMGRFLSICIVASDGDRVQSSVLYEVFDAWCKSSGEKSWSNRGFSMAMEERGYKRIQSNVMWWTNVKLVKSKDDFVDSQGHPIRMDGAKDRTEVGDDEI